jgi:cell division protein FtsZ
VSINGARGVLFAIAGSEDMTMHEIQEAARVITESVDANAKVIFGAIIDQKLRKGEIKITVIASGFPDTDSRNAKREQKTKEREQKQSTENLFGGGEKLVEVVRKDKEGAERAIFNTMPEEDPRAGKKNEEANRVEIEIDEEEEDDLGVIPSFLRRSKLR